MGTHRTPPWRGALAAAMLFSALACNFPLADFPSGPADPLPTRPVEGAAGQTDAPAPVTETAVPPSVTPFPTATATAEPFPVAGYVILTDIEEGDPWDQAVQLLAAYRQADILRFDNDVFELREALQARDVRYAAVMIKPEAMEEGLAFDVYTLAKEIDPGYATDFSYGFITGVQLQDMVGYIRQVIGYERGETPVQPVFRALWRSGEGALGGGAGGFADQNTAEAAQIFGSFGYESSRVDMDQVTKPEIMAELGSAGVVYFHAHGFPTMIECGQQCTGDAIQRDDAEALGNIRFVFASACYTASIGAYYNQALSGVERYEDRKIVLDPAGSIALGFLRSGSLAYVGHMCMWGRNDYIAVMLRALAEDPSLTTGDLLRTWYDTPSGPSLIGDSPVQDLVGMDNNRFMYAAVVLLGDPAVRIFPDATAAEQP